VTSPPAGATGGTRSLLELCRRHQLSSAASVDLQEDYDDSPDERQSVLLTPMTAISILALTPREELPPGGRGCDVVGVRPSSSRPSNISVIAEEISLARNDTEGLLVNDDVSDLRTSVAGSGRDACWTDNASLGMFIYLKTEYWQQRT
jgi:hypothetical protein